MEPINVVIDLSHAEDPVDLGSVIDSGVLAILHKASEGVGWVDPRYKSRALLAKEVGLLWGAYHYGTGANSGAAQADYFLETVGDFSATLLALDVEANPNGPSMSLPQAREFVTQIHDRTGRWPGLYGGHYLSQQLGIEPESVLTNCWLWWCRWEVGPGAVPPQFNDWTLWQYTDGKHGSGPYTVPGVGPCDRDQFNGDEVALRQLWTPSE